MKYKVCLFSYKDVLNLEYLDSFCQTVKNKLIPLLQFCPYDFHDEMTKSLIDGFTFGARRTKPST